MSLNISSKSFQILEFSKETPANNVLCSLIVRHTDKSSDIFRFRDKYNCRHL